MSDLVFPSQAWFDEYRRRIDDDDGYAEMASDWGVGFDGDILFEMTDVPVDEIDLDALPADLREELEAFVLPGDTGYAVLGLEAGECTRADFVASRADAEYGFVMSGTYDAWRELVTGRVGAVDGMMSGKFDVEGDMQKILSHSESASRLTELSASIDDRFVDEAF